MLLQSIGTILGLQGLGVGLIILVVDFVVVVEVVERVVGFTVVVVEVVVGLIVVVVEVVVGFLVVVLEVVVVGFIVVVVGFAVVVVEVVVVVGVGLSHNPEVQSSLL